MGKSKSSLFVQASHAAYDGHIPIGLSPETLWYMIVHEVAATIKKNPKKYAHLFTDRPR